MSVCCLCERPVVWSTPRKELPVPPLTRRAGEHVPWATIVSNASRHEDRDERTDSNSPRRTVHAIIEMFEEAMSDTGVPSDTEWAVYAACLMLTALIE